MLREEIKKFFKGEVSDDKTALAAASQDASIFEVKPEIVVFPKDREDLKNLVKFVSEEKSKGRKISLTARSGGTDMGGGPLSGSIVVDFTKHLNKLIEINKEYAVVEPGMFYRDFEKETDKLEVMMPSYPASKSICTVGGMVANNSGGEKTLLYGKTEKYVEELKIILSDGEEYIFKPVPVNHLEEEIQKRDFKGEIYAKLIKLIEENFKDIQAAKPDVSKNSSGYYLWNVWDKKTFDINKLLVGSQGTLGLITEIKFRLVPKKKYSQLAAVFIKDISLLPGLVEELSTFRPESLEVYDDKTLSLAIRFIPSLLKSLKLRALYLGWQFLPEIFMVLTGGLPKLVVLAEITGDDKKEIRKKLKLLKAKILKKYKVKVRLTRSQAESEKYWIIRRESFNLLRKHVSDRQAVPFIDDLIVQPKYVPEFLPKLEEILSKHKDKMEANIAGHAGDGNFHVIPLMDLSDPASRAIIPEVATQVYDLIRSFKGSNTAEHNDGLIRSSYLPKMYGEKIYKLFEETKKIFDPQNIFNPGKKVNANWNYAAAHIKKHK